MDKPKSVTVKTFNALGTELRLTEKGAVVIYVQNPDGSYRFSHSLTPSMAKLHAEYGCPVFQSIVASPEWAATLENKAKAKEQYKINTQLARELEKAQKYQQAAIDKIKAMGLDPAQVLKNIQVA